MLAPVVRARKGTQAKELDAARRAGFARVRVDGNMYDLSEEINLEKNIKHTVEIVVDRLVINDTVRGRLAAFHRNRAGAGKRACRHRRHWR